MRKRSSVESGAHFALALALALALSGCGVMFGGTTKDISVGSAPTAARLTTEPVTGSFTTPATLTLERKNSYTLVVWKEGYRETQIPIQKKMRTGPLILDIVFTGLLGVVVDHVTGGWWDLQPQAVAATLERLDDTIDGPAVITVTVSAADSDKESIRVDATDAVSLRLVKNQPLGSH